MYKNAFTLIFPSVQADKPSPMEDVLTAFLWQPALGDMQIILRNTPSKRFRSRWARFERKGMMSRCFIKCLQLDVK